MLYDIESRHGFLVVFANIITQLLQFTKPQKNTLNEKKNLSTMITEFFFISIVMILRSAPGKSPMYLSLLHCNLRAKNKRLKITKNEPLVFGCKINFTLV